jgi:dTDP-4-dehydrorhamnose reductase
MDKKAVCSMKILLLGKDGQVGWELQRALSPLGQLHALGRQEADFQNLEHLRTLVQRIEPQVIVNAAAYTAVDKAESEPDVAQCINAEAPRVLAEEAARQNAWLIHYSTDYVFNGEKSTPYAEDDPTGPLSVYGRTKLQGEQAIRQAQGKHLIFRTSWVYAARGGNFAKTMLRLAKERDELRVIADQFGAPTSAELIADITALALYRVSRTNEAGSILSGTYHLSAAGHTTWHGYAQYVLELARTRGIPLKTDAASVHAIPTSAYPTPAARPKNSRMNTAKLTNTFNLHPPDWRFHVQRLMDEITA